MIEAWLLEWRPWLLLQRSSSSSSSYLNPLSKPAKPPSLLLVQVATPAQEIIQNAVGPPWVPVNSEPETQRIQISEAQANWKRWRRLGSKLYVWVRTLLRRRLTHWKSKFVMCLLSSTNFDHTEFCVLYSRTRAALIDYPVPIRMRSLHMKYTGWRIFDYTSCTI